MRFLILTMILLIPANGSIAQDGRVPAMTVKKFLLHKRRLLFLVLAFVAIWIAVGIDQTVAQELPPKPAPGLHTTPTTLQAMAEEIEVFRVENEIPSVAVAIVHKGEIIFEQGFGFARLDERAQATSRTQYAIGSVSKVLTAAGLMRLVEQGVVDLDRPVNDYLGDTPLRSVVGDANEITVRHVATHTAGLTLYWHMVNDKDPLGVPSRTDQIRQYGVAQSLPGAQHLYSNLGYGVLARVIEVQSGMQFDEFMQREIFKPLGMKRTTMGPDPASKAAIKYSGRDDYSNQPVPDEPGLPIAKLTALTLASGHYYSTAHDLARFAIFNLKHPLGRKRPPLSHATLDEMHRPTVYQGKYIGQAVAWETVEDESEVLALEHAGGGPGMRARLELFPQDDFAMVLLVNDTRVLSFLGVKKIILAKLKPGFYGYRGALFGFPLESRAGGEVIGKSSEGLSEEEKRIQWLKAAKALKGQWDARIGGGPLGDHSMTLTIKETGDVFVDFDDIGLPGLLTRTDLSPTGIAGTSLGLVNPKYQWRNAPHYAHLFLDISQGQVAGRVEFTSIADLDETGIYSYYSMSYWAKFQRRPDDQPSDK